MLLTLTILSRSHIHSSNLANFSTLRTIARQISLLLMLIMTHDVVDKTLSVYTLLSTNIRMLSMACADRGYRQKATEQKATGQKATDKRPQDRRQLRQKATGQKATERNVKMLLSCQDVLERLLVVLKTVEQIVLSSVLVCRPSLFVVYRSSVLVNCSTTATVCIGQVSPCQWQTISSSTECTEHCRWK